MFGRRLGFADGRRTPRAQVLPSLNSMPFTQVQKLALHVKGQALESASPWIHPSLSSDANAPSDANAFTVTPQASGNLGQPFVPYPAPGASAVTVISYTVPRSKMAFIRYLSISHFGGNDPSGSGQVIWRVLVNGGGLRGLNQLTATFGTFAAPKSLTAPIIATENDTISVTVEVPSTFAPMSGGAGTAATFDGFTMPISEATLPTPGSY
jgi:hypothetical protein